MMIRVLNTVMLLDRGVPPVLNAWGAQVLRECG